MIENLSVLINDFLQVSRLAGLDLRRTDIEYERLPAPHQPGRLPRGMQSVYVFSLSDPFPLVLKVGKAGPRSNARFQSQHYNPRSSGSNLASSLLDDNDIWLNIRDEPQDEACIGAWMKDTLDRENFFIDSRLGPLPLNLLEIFLQCRLEPRYEG